MQTPPSVASERPVGDGLTSADRRYPGLTALSIFFGFGALAAATASVTLLFPGTAIDRVWRFNSRGHAGLAALGAWGVTLMAVVSTGCALAAWGLRKRVRWGHRLAIAILVVNVIADAVNGTLLGDPRSLIGVPIGTALVIYLLIPGVRALFHAGKPGIRAS